MMKILRLFALFLVILTVMPALFSCLDNPVETEAPQTSSTTDGGTSEQTGGAVTQEPYETYDPALDNSTVEKDENGKVLDTGRDVNPDTWVGTDGLGRVLLTNAEVGDVKTDKTVGIFYWTWHGTFASSVAAYNNQQIIDTYPDIDKNNFSDPRWGAANYHFWNEPLFGYYNGNDAWVIRKHAEMLADAGVDVILCDNTNGTYTWSATAMKVMKIFSEARADGVNSPDVSFMLPFGPGNDTVVQITELYNKIYSKELYKDVWFYWDEKPMLMAHGTSLSASNPTLKEMRDFFTFRPGQPVYDGSDKAVGKWGWLSIYPQDRYYAKAIDKRNDVVEQVAVGVAQNWGAKDGLTAMNGEYVFGRSYTYKDKFAHLEEEDSFLYGYNFSEQFEYAIELDPKFIFITAWNEWVAIRQRSWGGVENAFADQYNDEYSRDIEPCAGKLQDHYYYQMINYIRRFKGADKIPEASDAKRIDVMGGYGQWADVLPAFMSYSGNTEKRMSTGYIDPATGAALRYKNDTGRNDIYDAKVAQDSENVYFMVRCVDTITPYTDAQWMRLYIDVSDSEKSWETYEYILNRTSPASATSATLEAFTGSGFETSAVGNVEYSVKDNVLTVKIPRSMLGIGNGQFTLDFKWADNTQTDGNILDFYQSGDCAPGGRFKYRYISK